MKKNKPQISQYDKMTKTPVEKLVLGLSIPTTITMLVTNVYNLADTAFVGQLGNSASGAVGVVFGFMAIIQAIGFTFGQGGGSILSRTLGQKDTEEASRVASAGFIASLVFGLIGAVICFCCLEKLVLALGSTPTIAPYAKTYISYILLAMPFMVGSFVLNNYLRYEGKAFFGMVGMMTGGILNIIGDPILMFGLNLGIAGAGISTALSQTVSFFILLSTYLRGKTIIKLTFRGAKEGMHRLPDIVGTGFPALIRQGLSSLCTIVLNNNAKVYGDIAVAAMSICSRICFFIFAVGLGIGQGYQPVCAFNYGAKKYDRVRRAYKVTWIIGEIFMGVLTVIVLLNAEKFIYLFRADYDVVAIAKRALMLNGIAQLLMPFTTVTEMSFQTTGQKLYASMLSTLKSGLILIPTLIIMSNLRGLAGIQEAQPISHVISFIICIYFGLMFFRKLPKGDFEDEQSV